MRFLPIYLSRLLRARFQFNYDEIERDPILTPTEKLWARKMVEELKRPFLFQSWLDEWVEEQRARRREWFAWSMGAF